MMTHGSKEKLPQAKESTSVTMEVVALLRILAPVPTGGTALTAKPQYADIYSRREQSQAVRTGVFARQKTTALASPLTAFCGR